MEQISRKEKTRMIRYTQNVRNILNFIEKYGFITTRICSNLFYKDDKCKIDVARKVLNRLVNNKDIVANKNKYGRELIYQFGKNTVSDHSYYLLNLYAEINSIVTKIDYFKLEETWSLAKRRSDAHIIFRNNVNGELKFNAYLIEFDKYHKTNPNEKYNSIYDSNEVQEWYKEHHNMDEFFPDVLIVNYNGQVSKSSNEDFNIIGIDYDFNELLQKIVLPQ
jgi:hypothetical protein